MPIRSDNRRLYPPDWRRIRERILIRAQHCCEQCGRPDRVVVLVTDDGRWQRYEWDSVGHSEWRDSRGDFCGGTQRIVECCCDDPPEYHVTRTVLTVAHLDHDPTHNDEANLRALCQRCHLTHDAKHRASNARRTRARKRGQQELKGM